LRSNCILQLSDFKWQTSPPTSVPPPLSPLRGREQNAGEKKHARAKPTKLLSNPVIFQTIDFTLVAIIARQQPPPFSETNFSYTYTDIEYMRAIHNFQYRRDLPDRYYPHRISPSNEYILYIGWSINTHRYRSRYFRRLRVEKAILYRVIHPQAFTHSSIFWKLISSNSDFWNF